MAKRGRKKKIVDNIDKIIDQEEFNYKTSKSKKDIIEEPIKIKRNKKNIAIFVDSLFCYDETIGEKFELNVYRVQPKSKDIDDLDSNEYMYVAYNSDFIDELDSDIIHTPLGAATITEFSEDDELLDEEYYSY